MIVDLAKPPEDADVSWEMLWRFYLVPCLYLAPGLKEDKRFLKVVNFKCFLKSKKDLE